MMRNLKSEQILNKARASVAGGADSSARVPDYHIPIVIDRADGAWVEDVDGNRLIDMNMGYGPLIFGHKNPIILKAIQDEMEKRGTILGFPHEVSYKAAELIKKSFPSIEKMRFTSSGTEAVQTAVRLARRYSGKPDIVLFEGHYHGSSDAVFHLYHPPLAELQKKHFIPLAGTGGMNDSPRHTFALPWNDAALLRAFFDKHGETVAAVIMEPVMGNSGVVPPASGFLESARQLTRQYGSVLIFDEVITGFRIARGGAQERFGVASDLTTLSKAMSGGVPAAAIGGRQEIMVLLENNAVFHGGVYSGNQISTAATLAVQQEFDKHHQQIYSQLDTMSQRLVDGLTTLFDHAGIPAVIQNVGPMLSLWFPKNGEVFEATCYRDVEMRADPKMFIRFQHALQQAGVYVHPNHFEPWYLSTAHVEKVIDEVLQRVEFAITKLDPPKKR